MPGRKRHLAALALSIALSAPGFAHAQTHSSTPGSDGYPCGSGPRLEIIQRGEDFAIEPAAETTGPVKRATRAMIAVGRALHFDRALLEAAGRREMEVRDDVRP